MVGRRQCRHPDDPGAELDGVVDGVGIDATRCIVQHDTGEQLYIGFGEQLLQEDRVRHAGIEVILVEHGAKFRFRRIEQFLVMIEDARHRRRAAMAVQIDRADQKLGDFGSP